MNCDELHRVLFPYRQQLRYKEQKILKEWLQLTVHYTSKLRPTGISNIHIIPVHII